MSTHRARSKNRACKLTRVREETVVTSFVPVSEYMPCRTRMSPLSACLRHHYSKTFTNHKPSPFRACFTPKYSVLHRNTPTPAIQLTSTAPSIQASFFGCFFGPMFMLTPRCIAAQFSQSANHSKAFPANLTGKARKHSKRPAIEGCLQLVL
jgi:hypothetical protein